MNSTVGAISNKVVGEVLDVLAEMRDQPRHQRQRHRDVAPEHVTERQIDDGTMLLLGKRRIVVDEVAGGGEMLAVRDQRALGMARSCPRCRR